MADETQQATTNSALPFGSRAKQGISQFHGVRSYLCAHVQDRASRPSRVAPSAPHAARSDVRRRCVRPRRGTSARIHDTMAMALFGHGLFKNSNKYNAALPNLMRAYATKIKNVPIDKKKTPKIDYNPESLAAKGFLRAQNAYSPPADVSSRFQSICTRVLGSESASLTDNNKKFQLLNICQQEFNHSVPNSLLYTLETTEDVLKFYNTPVDVNIPLDAMRSMDLPSNLHIEYEYNRFHPENDTMFNGVTAYPRSSTLVTGLTTKKKYRGFEANQTWPYNT